RPSGHRPSLRRRPHAGGRRVDPLPTGSRPRKRRTSPIRTAGNARARTNGLRAGNLHSRAYFGFLQVMALEQGEFELELRHLRVFEVLLREHSLTRAAEVLGVTQPALSKTLASLRGYFSDPLFVRV